MLHPDDPILHAIVRAAHHPDPRRADRADLSLCRPTGSTALRDVAAFERLGALARARTALAAVWGLVAVHRPEPAPCC